MRRSCGAQPYTGYDTLSDLAGSHRVLCIGFTGDAVTQVAADQLNRPQPEDVPKELREVLPKRLVPRGGHNTHCGHNDDVEENIKHNAESHTLPELNLGPIFSHHAVEHRKEDSEREVH